MDQQAQQQQHMQQVRYMEKSVIIHRDENGFGFRVGGDNPVLVAHVYDDGAAWKAGVRKNDRIIKVNGTLVKLLDHKTVVVMIQNCSPFVNLTLHSPGPDVSIPITLPTGSPFTADAINSMAPIPTSRPPPNTQSNNINTSNLATSTGIIPYTVQHHHIHHQSHPGAAAGNTNWLFEIGDDLFQDISHSYHHTPQAIPVTSAAINQSPTATNSNTTGVSKLIVSGPNPPSSSTPKHLHLSNNNGIKSKVRHNRNQATTRDNPHYYYKTNTQDKTNESMNSNQTAPDQLATRSGLSIARSRSSSSKLPTRFSTSKYKSKNLKTRLVEDLRSLTITNNQVTSSSLSTSPSSSDLSDCDDQDPLTRLDFGLNTSTSGGNFLQSTNTSSSGQTLSISSTVPTRQTTRRLEVIRELIDTEKTHHERLKHLNDLLYKPIKAEGLVPQEQLKMVFSCHKSLFKIHRQIYKLLLQAQSNKSRYTNEPLIGKTLVEIFEGELGKKLERAACTFCACQATNTEYLNKFTRKEAKVGEFLAQLANQQMLGRLGIKDLLASCFQRLTKYPLLLESLLKAIPVGIHTKSLSDGSIATHMAAAINSANGDLKSSQNLSKNPDINAQEEAESPDGKKNSETDNNNSISNDNNNSTTKIYQDIIHEASSDEFDYERLCITRALHQSRRILIHVNEAVEKATSYEKLKEIWKKTDKHPAVPVIDINMQELFHDGPLTLRLSKRSFEVYVLLLTHYLVILTRDGQDKYKLKHFTAEGKVATQFSPIFKIDEHLATRDTATDENGFYLLCKKKDDERIYEFASPSPADRIKWKEKIHRAQIYNLASVPEDDNTLTRYRELISLVAPNTSTILCDVNPQQQQQALSNTTTLISNPTEVSSATFASQPPSPQVSTNG